MDAIACEQAAKDASRIAVAGGSLTEIIYFLGAEDRIVATDSTSLFPKEAQSFPSVGYVRALATEGLLSLQPTLILGEHDMGPPETVEQLKLLGVEVVRVPEEASSQGIVEKMRCVARVLSLEARLRERLPKLQATLGKLAEIGDQPSAHKGALLLGLRDGAPLAAGTNTSGDGVLSMAGAQNAFAQLDGWKPVSFESMLLADPDFIVIPERGVDQAGGLEKLLKHPGLRATRAVQEGRVVVMDGMSLLGFGPRTLEAAVELYRAVNNPGGRS